MVSKESLLYLGSFLCDNGSIGPELNRRLGAARAEFETLCRVWNHAVLPKEEKIRIFEACVLSKLLYCLHTAQVLSAPFFVGFVGVFPAFAGRHAVVEGADGFVEGWKYTNPIRQGQSQKSWFQSVGQV